MSTFYLEIEMGNAAMMDTTDIRYALRSVNGKLADGNKSGTIKDENGNTVGKFGFK
jgi:hypothetical protein